MAIMIGEDNILSNKYPCPVEYDGAVYPSAESAFQATRFEPGYTKLKFLRLPSFRAEYEGGRTRATVPGWDNLKYDLMYGVLRAKLKNPDFKSALLATGGEDIIITNKNHEREWGTCSCLKCGGAGRNSLGKLLMQLRSELESRQS